MQFLPGVPMAHPVPTLAFDERVKEISRKYEDILTFKYSGPWPPYNFVNIKLKLERAD